MKNLLLAITLLMLSLAALSQRITYIGAETAFTGDIYEYADPTQTFHPIFLPQGLWGFHLRQDLNKHFSLEAGIILKYYDMGYGFDINPVVTGTSTRAINAWQFPLRLHSRLPIVPNTLYFVPTIGYSFCINPDMNSWGRGLFILGAPDGDTLVVTETIDMGMAKNFSLIETGLGFEVRLFKKLILSYSASYFTGFQKVMGTDLQFSLNGGPASTASFYSKGEYWRVGLGLRYPISDLWMKRDE